MSRNEDIAIIGGGASGLVAGILLARKGYKVTIFEKNAKLGRKILATGNGRCNVTNENIHPQNYHSQNENFVEYILKTFNTKECIEFFQSIGVMLAKKPTNRYYPMSRQASSVVDALAYELQRLKVTIYLESLVEKLSTCKDKFALHVKEKQYSFHRVFIATGGKTMKKLGSSDSGYGFAKSFGHGVVKTYPSLVQLVTKEDTKSIKGVKFEGSIKLLGTNVSSFGDILFASYGISGSAVLDISFHLKGEEKRVVIDCLPSISKQMLANMFFSSIKTAPPRPLYLWLNGFINQKLALFVLKKCKINHEKSTKLLTRKEINALVFTLKNLQFHIIDTKGFEFAEVTAGGVDTKEINPKTLESKLVKNLYFLGEVLDVVGDCGGYNLHFAWGCAYVAVNALAN